MILMMLLYWGPIIVAVVLGVRWFFGQGKDSQSDSPLEILRQRYMHSEMNKEEFQSRKKDLS